MIATDKEGIFAIGSNAHGQCGRPVIENEDYSSTNIVKCVHGIEGVPVQAVCGYDHSIIVSREGNVYTFGNGTDGQLGNGAYDSKWEPQLVRGDIGSERIVRVAATADTVLALSDKGELFGWGNSEYRQLECAVGEVPQVAVPRHLPLSVGKVTSMAAGGSACALVNHEGRMFVWGFGILGQGPDNLSKSLPSEIPLAIFGNTEIDRDNLVSQVFAGPMHFAAVTNKGALYMWGKNRYGLLGLGHEKDQFFPMKVNINGDVKSVSCGPDHSIAVTRPLI